jgi:putative ABC transport system permease protein
MLRATFKNLLARKLRLALSAFAIVLGVAFVAGSYVFTDTLNRGFTDIFAKVAPDVTVRPENAQDTVDFGATSRTVPASIVDEIARVDGVRQVEGDISNPQTFVLDKHDKVVGGSGAPGLGVNWYEAENSAGDSIATIVDGRAPERTGEIALDAKTIEKTGYELGDTVPLVLATDQPRIEAEVVGVVRFGDSQSLLGATLTVFDTRTAQELFLGGDNAFTSLTVVTESPDDQAAVRDQIDAILPQGYEAVTAGKLIEESKTSIQEGLSFINNFLLVFAGVSLFVGVFLIINTFGILVAQRTQELALFRALGASRRQVTRSVLLEALIVGLVGSTMGLALGFLLALGLKALFATLGLDLSGVGLVFQWRTALIAYLVGTVVTVIAAYGPARRASRVPPVAAMRDDIALPETSIRRRTLGGAALVALGVGGLVLGFTIDNFPAVAGGAAAVFIGVALLAPFIGRPVVNVLGAAYPKLFGTVGQLARENAKRNPRRTAATASALMIGLALVSTMAVLGQSAKRSTDELVSTDLRADYVISNAIGMPFSPTIGEQAAAVSGVESAAAIRAAIAERDGAVEFLAALDPATLGPMVDLQLSNGSRDRFGLESVLVEAGVAKERGHRVGDLITLTFPAGPQELRVAGTYVRTPFVGANYVVSPPVLERGGIPPMDTVVYLTRAPEADAAHVKSALDRIVAPLPTVTLKDQDAYADELRAPIDQFLAIIYALLGLAVVIAVLGIVNTLALSVLERTREVGLLRAVGLTRRQLRTMVRLESVVISVLGAVLGVGLGLAFGVALQRAIADQGLEVLAIPFGQLIGFVVIAGLIGVLAAVFPARRAARLDVLRAITTE